MDQSLNILGISGSLRKGSFNTSALRAAQQLAPRDMTIESFDLQGIPVFTQDEEADPPERVALFKSKIKAADAILFVTPEYNYSIPGVLKNAIDWASRPYGSSAWDGKPAAIMGVSGGIFGTARAQYHLRQIFVFLNVYPVNRPEVMIGNAAQRFDQEGNLTDEPARESIRKLLAALAKWTRQLKVSEA
jgi:chromate reductase